MAGARKTFVKNFENFKGLDLKTSDLTKRQDFAKQCLNAEFSEGFSVRKRKGSQIIGQVGPFTRTHTYSYQDRTTGETKQELLAINDYLWRLKYEDITCIRTAGPASTGYRVTFGNFGGVDQYKFELLENGTPVNMTHPVTGATNAYLLLGTGLEIPGSTNYTSLLDLFESIDGVPNWSLSAYPSNSGRTTSAGTAYVIPLDNPHTFATNIPLSSMYNYVAGVTRLVPIRVNVATNPAQITIQSFIDRDNNLIPMTRVNNQTIGSAAGSAAQLELGTVTGTGTGFTIRYYYWAPVPWYSSDYPTGFTTYKNENKTPFDLSYTQQGNRQTPAPHFVNAANVCYLYTGAQLTQGTGLVPAAYEFYPYKYDGISVYRSGLPQPVIQQITTTVGTVPNGVYKYKAVFEFIDAQGNIVESQPSEAFSFTISGGAKNILVWIPWLLQQKSLTDPDYTTFSVGAVATNVLTLTANKFQIGDVVAFRDVSGVPIRFVTRLITAVNLGANQITINGPAVDVGLAEPIVRNPFSGFKAGQDFNFVGAATSTTLTTNSSVGIEVGDIIFHRSSGAGLLESTRKVVSYTATTVTLDSPLTVNGEHFSLNGKIALYRTKSGGNLFYLVARYPLSGFNFLDDALLDTALGEQLIEPEIGKERDLPPRASVGCIHQGGMVYGGIWQQPNTLAWNDPISGLENAPLASNYTDVPSTITGPIVAVASENEDRLAVFKDYGYYDLPGDLLGGNFSIKTVREGDYGVSAQSSLVKVEESLIGVGPNGMVRVRDGQLSPDIGIPIGPPIYDNSNLELRQAISFIDYPRRRVICYLPSTDYVNPLIYVYDFGNGGIWFDWAYQRGLLAPSSGGAVAALPGSSVPEVFTASRQIDGSLLVGGIYKRSSNTVETLNYLDISNPITFTWRTAWEHLQDPSVSKQFLRLRIFSLYSTGEAQLYTNCTLGIQTFKNFYEAVAHMSTSVVFSTASQYQSTVKLRSDQMRAIQFVFSNNVVGESPHITGYEFVVAECYDKDDLAE